MIKMRSSPTLSTHISAETAFELICIPLLSCDFDFVKRIFCSCFSFDYNIIRTRNRDTMLD